MNSTEVDNLRELLRSACRKAGEAVALSAPGRVPLTFARFAAQVDYVGGALRQCGLARTSRVAVVLPDGPDMAAAFWGVAAYAVCAPLNPSYREEELEFCLKDVAAEGVILPAGQECAARHVAHKLGIKVIDLAPGANYAVGGFQFQNADGKASAPSDWGRQDDIALVLHTSGTAARPKLVPLSHRQICAAAGNIAQVLRLSPADRCLNVMPLFHIHGLSALFSTIATGGNIVCPEEFSASHFGRLLKEFRPTWYTAAPALHRLIIENLNGEAHSAAECGLRFIRSASAPMPAELIPRLEQVFAAPVIEAYGMTEAAPQIASNRLPPFERRPGSVGPAAGPDIAIMDESANLLPAGELGEVVIRGENVISAYENNPAANARAFVRGWFRTGDQGRLDADGWLYITGRMDEIINRGGEKISPRQVDEVLLSHPSVADAVTFAVPHSVLGQNVAAAVVFRSMSIAADGETTTSDQSARRIREIQQFAAARLAHFKIPQQIVVVDEIPQGPTGKLRRKELAARLQPLLNHNPPTDKSPDGDRPHSPLELRIAEIWAAVLRIAVPGVHENFFQLGGESLSAAQVVGRMRQLLHVDLPVNSLFERPTVAGLAELVCSRLADLAAEGRLRLESAESLHSAVIARRPEHSNPPPLSLAQQGLWFLDQIGSAAAYHMSASLQLRGPLDQAALAAALNEIRRRHEILRTTMRQHGGELVQQIAPATTVRLPVWDLTTIPAANREAESLRLAQEEFAAAFDLAQGPLFRAALIRLSAVDHLLSLTMHHIVSDGWSTRLLQRELLVIYDAFALGRPSPLAELPIQYADFAVWQRQRLSDGGLEPDGAYWKQQLRSMPPVINLPTDRPRPATPTHRGSTRHTTIRRELLSQLREFSRREDATLFMTLLAGFKTLLLRWTGQVDCVVGVPIANRRPVETEGLIGFFANTLVLRTNLSGDPSFAELLRRVRATALGAFAHQDFPFDKLVEAINPQRKLNHAPLVQVMFAFQNLPDENPGRAFDLAPGLTASPVELDHPAAKFDLTLYLSESARGVDIAWHYNADLFDDSTIERLARQFASLLKGIVEDPRRRLSELPIPTDVEQSADADERPVAALVEPWKGGFARQFEFHAYATPHATAVVCGGERLTYAELNRRANQLARFLQSRGVGPHTLVGVCLPRSAEIVVSLLAILKAGGAFVPFDPDYPAERLAFMLAESRVPVLITEQCLLKTLRLPSVGANAEIENSVSRSADKPRVLCLHSEREWVGAESTHDLAVKATATDLAYAIYTSGSSGRPKAAMISQGNLSHYVTAMRRSLGITAGDRCLHTASFAFSSAVRQFAVPLSCGAAVVIAPAEQIRDPHSLWQVICDERVTTIDLVPSYWRSCLQSLASLAPADRAALLQNDLRLIVSASEPLPADLPRAWAACFPRPVSMINMFGQTETTGIVTIYPLAEPAGDAGPFVPIGRPIAGTQAYVLNADRQPVPVGVQGELYIGGAGVGLGYLHQPTLSAERFFPDPFSGETNDRMYRTGDLARLRADGNLEFIGRADEQIKIRGFRVEPGEIETVLRQHPRVQDAAVVAWGETAAANGAGLRLAAFVVPVGGGRGGEHLIDELRAHVRQSLPEYMAPKSIVELPDLPRTPTGKLDRKSLAAGSSWIREQDGDKPSPTGPGPQSGARRAWAENALVDIWKQVLRISRLEIDQNFFDVGGDSILAIQIVAQANDAGLNITLRQLYQQQTVQGLVAAWEAQPGGPTSRAEAPVQSSEQRDDAPSAHRHASPQERFSRAAEDEPSVVVTVESLRAFGREALERAGLDAAGARIVTEVQLEASLRGQRTHHIGSIPRYARRIAAGKINPRPNIRIEKESPVSAQVDGDNGPGQWVSVVAMETALHKAQTRGVGIVTVRRSNHFGAAGHYAWQAARAGFIGLCTTNGPVILAPTGGVTPTFGNNPLGVGIPSAGKHPVLLDIAMSVAPRGKIGLHLAADKPLGPDWILDHRGRPSTNLADLAAGLGVPIGGHKGYGLTFVMEILSGVLSGAGFGLDHGRELIRQYAAPSDIGHFFLVIDPAMFMPLPDFEARVAQLIDQAKSGERAEHTDEILVPGELELRTRERSLKSGVRLDASSYATLARYGAEAGLSTELTAVAPKEPVRESAASRDTAASHD